MPQSPKDVFKASYKKHRIFTKDNPAPSDFNKIDRDYAQALYTADRINKGTQNRKTIIAFVRQGKKNYRVRLKGAKIINDAYTGLRHKTATPPYTTSKAEYDTMSLPPGQTFQRLPNRRYYDTLNDEEISRRERDKRVKQLFPEIKEEKV